MVPTIENLKPSHSLSAIRGLGIILINLVYYLATQLQIPMQQVARKKEGELRIMNKVLQNYIPYCKKFLRKKKKKKKNVNFVKILDQIPYVVTLIKVIMDVKGVSVLIKAIHNEWSTKQAKKKFFLFPFLMIRASCYGMLQCVECIENDWSLISLFDCMLNFSLVF